MTFRHAREPGLSPPRSVLTVTSRDGNVRPGTCVHSATMASSLHADSHRIHAIYTLRRGEDHAWSCSCEHAKAKAPPSPT